MNSELKENEKILEVCYEDSYNKRFNISNPYYYIVSDGFKVSDGDIILVEPRVPENKNIFNLQFALITGVYDKSNIEVLNEDAIKRANKPFYISDIDLSEYTALRERQTRKLEIEKQLNTAVKQLEKVAKYKAASELNPELKSLYEEYAGIIKSESIHQLTSGKDE